MQATKKALKTQVHSTGKYSESTPTVLFRTTTHFHDHTFDHTDTEILSDSHGNQIQTLFEVPNMVLVHQEIAAEMRLISFCPGIITAGRPSVDKKDKTG